MKIFTYPNKSVPEHGEALVELLINIELNQINTSAFTSNDSMVFQLEIIF
jgi:hypothetical protein